MAATNNLTQWIGATTPSSNQWPLRKMIEPLTDRASTLAITTAGLVIKAGGSALVKSGSADAYFLANGVLLKIAASTDMPAFVGTVVNATFNVFCFFVDSAGTKTAAMGTAGTTLAKVVFPPFPKQKALIGFVIINPTGTGNFVGGTTALDDATVVPNAVDISPVGGFDPAALIG